MAATIRKIAEAMGVSRGTVDRALHDKGRVDADLAKRIKAFAEEVGYRPNAAAKGLTLKKDKIHISVILHISKLNFFFESVMEGVKEGIAEVQDYGIVVEVEYCDDFNAEKQLEIINKCVEAKTNGIILVPIDSPLIRDRVNDLTASGLPVVFLSNIIDGADFLSFVGCNYRLCGEIAAGLFNMLAPDHGKLLCFSPSFQMYGHILRNNGLIENIKTNYPQIEVLDVIELFEEAEGAYEITRNALMKYPDVSLILCPSVSAENNLKAISDAGYAHKVKIVAYDYKDVIGDALYSRVVAATITQQPALQGYTAVKTMFDFFIFNMKTPEKFNYVKNRILLREHLGETGYYAASKESV